VSRHLIVNADDFGSTEGINRAVADCHRAGTVTSASLMAIGEAAAHAAQLADELPRLSIGLHWVGDRPGVAMVDMRDEQAIVAELERQLGLFEDLLGRPPTHLDSHHHLHFAGHAMKPFAAFGARLGIPLRGDGPVRYVGGFYGQWEHGVTDLEHVSVQALGAILRDELDETGWTEIGCHPGYVTGELRSAYTHEREAEVRTLTDPRIPALIAELGIELQSYADFARWLGGVRRRQGRSSTRR
jgi:chitin disaccharide deacetylase